MGVFGPKQIETKSSLNSKYSFESKIVNFKFLKQVQSKRVFPL